MKKNRKKLPDFNKMSYEKEATWWDTHDLGDYWHEFTEVGMVFNLEKPRNETLVVRLQKSLKDRLKVVAKSQGLDPSGYVRMLLIEKLRQVPSKKT